MPEETTEEWEANERVSGDLFREWYSKEIWGQRAIDDDALFEVMSLQVFQAGLTWQMVLKRRDSFRAAFADWKIDDVAAMGSTPNLVMERVDEIDQRQGASLQGVGQLFNCAVDGGGVVVGEAKSCDGKSRARGRSSRRCRTCRGCGGWPC